MILSFCLGRRDEKRKKGKDFRLSFNVSDDEEEEEEDITLDFHIMHDDNH